MCRNKNIIIWSDFLTKKIRMYLKDNKKVVITIGAIVLLVGVGTLSMSNAQYRSRQTTLIEDNSKLLKDVQQFKKDTKELDNLVKGLEDSVVTLKEDVTKLEDDKKKLSQQNTEVMKMLDDKTKEVDTVKKNLANRSSAKSVEEVRNKASKTKQVENDTNAKAQTSQPQQKQNESPQQAKVQETQSTSSNGRTITMQASSYTSCPSENGGYSTTATGKPLSYGVVAVDRNVIPLGTKMKIEGFGNTVFSAEDVGGAIKGNRLDILMNSKGEALNFGRRSVKVTILK